MIIMIDNKDSFTYNLVDYLQVESTTEMTVIDIDDVHIDTIEAMSPQAIVISPGPGTPDDYPALYAVLEAFKGRVPILGVCLGFQCIVSYFGGDIVKSPRPVHGETTRIRHTGKSVYRSLPETFEVMRYHSLTAARDTLPNELEITAENDTALIMGVMHKTYCIHAVQYHPESILSMYGHEQIRNFLMEAGVHVANRV